MYEPDEYELAAARFPKTAPAFDIDQPPEPVYRPTAANTPDSVFKQASQAQSGRIGSGITGPQVSSPTVAPVARQAPVSVTAFSRQSPEQQAFNQSGTSQGGIPLSLVTAPGGARFTVAQDHAPRFNAFLNALHGAGYAIDGGQSGGYNYRNIAGTNRLSNHSYGSAIDINWNQNPRNGSLGHIAETIGADKVRALAAAHGLKWGGDWNNPDAMHFEVNGAWNGQPANVPVAKRAPSAFASADPSGRQAERTVYNQEMSPDPNRPGPRMTAAYDQRFQNGHPMDAMPAHQNMMALGMGSGQQQQRPNAFRGATWSNDPLGVTWGNGDFSAFDIRG